ncbi:unnamed protein product [Linum trigynum]|uniref:Uncharacterized protein n=1 Tax=Linum trigynum TaxID=586398 RepID=A0AAV2GW13_9ROSI
MLSSQSEDENPLLLESIPLLGSSSIERERRVSTSNATDRRRGRVMAGHWRCWRPTARMSHDWALAMVETDGEDEARLAMMETDGARLWRLAERTLQPATKPPAGGGRPLETAGAVDCWREGREVTKERGGRLWVLLS